MVAAMPCCTARFMFTRSLLCDSPLLLVRTAFFLSFLHSIKRRLSIEKPGPTLLGGMIDNHNFFEKKRAGAFENTVAVQKLLFLAACTLIAFDIDFFEDKHVVSIQPNHTKLFQCPVRFLSGLMDEHGLCPPR